MIDLPPDMIARMSDPSSVITEFWHPSVPVRKFVTKEATQNNYHRQPSDEDRFPSFLALQERTIPAGNDSLRFATNDGSDAQSKLESNGKKMSCECRFVRDYSADDTFNIDNVDDLLSGASKSASEPSNAAVSSGLLQEKQTLT